MNCFKICCRKNSFSENLQRKNNLKPQSEKTTNKISLCTTLGWGPSKVYSGIKWCFSYISKCKNTSTEKTDFLYASRFNSYQTPYNQQFNPVVVDCIKHIELEDKSSLDNNNQEIIVYNYLFDLVNRKKSGPFFDYKKEPLIWKKIFLDETTLSNSIKENPEIFFKELADFCVNYLAFAKSFPPYINWDYFAKYYPEEFVHIFFSFFTHKNYEVKYDYRFYDYLFDGRHHKYGSVKILFDHLLANDVHIMKLVIKKLIEKNYDNVFSVFKLLSEDIIERGINWDGHSWYKAYPVPNRNENLTSLWCYLAKENLLKPLYNLSTISFSEAFRIDFNNSKSSMTQIFEIVRISNDIELKKIVFSSLPSDTDVTYQLFPLFENAILNNDTKLYSELSEYYSSIVNIDKITEAFQDT